MLICRAAANQRRAARFGESDPPPRPLRRRATPAGRPQRSNARSWAIAARRTSCPPAPSLGPAPAQRRPPLQRGLAPSYPREPPRGRCRRAQPVALRQNTTHTPRSPAASGQHLGQAEHAEPPNHPARHTRGVPCRLLPVTGRKKNCQPDACSPRTTMAEPQAMSPRRGARGPALTCGPCFSHRDLCPAPLLAAPNQAAHWYQRTSADRRSPLPLYIALCRHVVPSTVGSNLTPPAAGQPSPAADSSHSVGLPKHSKPPAVPLCNTAAPSD